MLVSHHYRLAHIESPVINVGICIQHAFIWAIQCRNTTFPILTFAHTRNIDVSSAFFSFFVVCWLNLTSYPRFCAVLIQNARTFQKSNANHSDSLVNFHFYSNNFFLFVSFSNWTIDTWTHQWPKFIVVDMKLNQRTILSIYVWFNSTKDCVTGHPWREWRAEQKSWPYFI